MNYKEKDIRWLQRFSNYCKALAQLEKFILKKNLNELEEQGLIKAFEYTYELAWSTLKDYLEYQGSSNIAGSRDAIREAFQAGLISDGEAWMEMLKTRNKTAHTYNKATAKEIATAVTNRYYQLFQDLQQTMTDLQAKLPLFSPNEKNK